MLSLRFLTRRMKKVITLGEGFDVDLPKFIETRALIASNSGGGKSWLLRRLLEQTNGQVQQIVIDLEGEFYTLREKFDNYLLIGKDGDIPADVRGAGILPIKLLELSASAIIDLSELKFHERKRFVKLFLENLLEAPHELRHPVIVALDEAHHFCPQVGEAESTGAVIDLMTRGRKRGLCGVLATQRVSKLHKDAIAECNNKMFGRTSQDIDVKRTSDELGFTKSKKEAFETLRNLKAGEFFAFGTAIGSNVELYKVGDVQTTHQQTGSRGKLSVQKPVPPKSAIKQIIAKLADLPQEAEKKAKSEAELKKEIATLKATVTRLEKAPQETVVDQKAVAVAVNKAITERDKEWRKAYDNLIRYSGNLYSALKSLKTSAEQAVTSYAREEVDFTPPEAPPLCQSVKFDTPPIVVPKTLKKTAEAMVGREPLLDAPQARREYALDADDIILKKGARRMLETLVSRYPMKFTRSQWATLSNMKKTSGTFSSYLSALRSGNLIVEEGELVYASETGIAYLGGDVPTPQTAEETRKMWRGHLKQGARRMFDVLESAYPVQTTREELALGADISAQSGTFSSYLSALRSNGLIEEIGQELKLSDDLFIQ